MIDRQYITFFEKHALLNLVCYFYVYKVQQTNIKLIQNTLSKNNTNALKFKRTQLHRQHASQFIILLCVSKKCIFVECFKCQFKKCFWLTKTLNLAYLKTLNSYLFIWMRFQQCCADKPRTKHNVNTSLA